MATDLQKPDAVDRRIQYMKEAISMVPNEDRAEAECE